MESVCAVNAKTFEERVMRVHHIGLVCSSEENAERFYRGLLGCERTRSYPVPAELSKGLFDFDCTYPAHVYVKDDITVEVFVVEGGAATHPRIHHVGLEVEDMKTFLERCRSMQVQIMEVPKGEKIITMIKDFDGNMFEIKAV